MLHHHDKSPPHDLACAPGDSSIQLFPAVCHPCLGSVHQGPVPHCNQVDNSEAETLAPGSWLARDREQALLLIFKPFRGMKRGREGALVPLPLVCSIRRNDPKPCCLTILETSLEVYSIGEHVTREVTVLIVSGSMSAHLLITMKVLCTVIKHKIFTTQIWESLVPLLTSFS